MSKIYHVGKNGNNKNNGSDESKFLTIQQAANVAVSGDTIIVHEGTYREWVKPKNAGSDKFHPITYKVAQNEKVFIKGSEVIKNWKHLENGIWMNEINNEIFGNFNPFEVELNGDWYRNQENLIAHHGSLYVDGFAFYEASNLEKLKNPTFRTNFVNEDFNLPETNPCPEKTIYQWYAVVEKEKSILYANFHEINPNESLTEISVRKSCFMPDKIGINYITLQGFNLSQTATPWAPPTGEQIGLIGPHWSKGWIIEDNIIHDSKCSGISLGKEISTGNNETSRYQMNPGYQNQLEAIFKALKIGWSKETIGSHIIRNNKIYDCGQAGIVGHMGGVFSEIYHNNIYNIATRHEFTGSEMAGIKLHASIDVRIKDNIFHDNTLGLWLDWEAQGSIMSRNLFFNNNMDTMVEVASGPYLYENNIFASKYNFNNVSQGGAFVHNIFCGFSTLGKALNRSTPYHFAHSTAVAGCSLTFGGDDRYYNNIFLGDSKLFLPNSYNGSDGYNGSPISYKEFHDIVAKMPKHNYLNKFIETKQPAFIDGNIYLCGAQPFDREQHFIKNSDTTEKLEIIQKDNSFYILFNTNLDLKKINTSIIDTEKLGRVRVAKLIFDDVYGSNIIIDKDINGHKRSRNPTPGPFESLKVGKNKIKVWE